MTATATVHESFYTVSGRIFAALQFPGERLTVGVQLEADDGVQWTIIDNNVRFGQKIHAILSLKAEEGIYMYELQAINHQSKPAVGQILTIRS